MREGQALNKMYRLARTTGTLLRRIGICINRGLRFLCRVIDATIYKSGARLWEWGFSKEFPNFGKSTYTSR